MLTDLSSPVKPTSKRSCLIELLLLLLSHSHSLLYLDLMTPPACPKVFSWNLLPLVGLDVMDTLWVFNLPFYLVMKITKLFSPCVFRNPNQTWSIVFRGGEWKCGPRGKILACPDSSSKNQTVCGRTFEKKSREIFILHVWVCWQQRLGLRKRNQEWTGVTSFRIKSGKIEISRKVHSGW